MTRIAQVRWIISAILAVPVLLVIVVAIRIIGALSSIPVAIGKRIDIEDEARYLVNQAVDVDVAHDFRDDLLYLMEKHVYQSNLDPDRFDRWGLLRQIDEHREETIEDLRAGEFAISMGGALFSVAIGIWLDIRFAGVGLTVVLFFFSILVILRVVVTDLLSFQSRDVRNDSIESLILKRGWNETPVNHGASLVLASILLTVSSSDWGYQLGLRAVDWLGTGSNPKANNKYSVTTDYEN